MFLSTTPTQFFNTSWDNDSHHHGDVAHVTHPTFCDTRKSCKSRGWHCLKPTAYTAPSHWVSLLEVKVDNPKQYLLSWKAWLSWCLLTTYLTTHSPYFDLTSVVSCSNRWTCSVISSPEEPPTKQGEVRHSEGPCVCRSAGSPHGYVKELRATALWSPNCCSSCFRNPQVPSQRKLFNTRAMLRGAKWISSSRGNY